MTDVGLFSYKKFFLKGDRNMQGTVHTKRFIFHEFQGVFSFFQDFQVLENGISFSRKFKEFQGVCEPCAREFVIIIILNVSGQT